MQKRGKNKMICSRCGTNIDDNATECEYCGLKFKIDKPQAMFDGNNNNWQKTAVTNTYIIPDSSDSEEKTEKMCIIAVVCIIVTLIIGAAGYYFYENYKLGEKYSSIVDKYGLTNQQIEDSISESYYKKWYSSSKDTITFTKDKIIQENGEEKDIRFDYRIKNIYRKEITHKFTITVVVDDFYYKFEPRARFDENGNIEYTCLYIYFGGTEGDFSNLDYRIVYDTDPQYINQE